MLLLLHHDHLVYLRVHHANIGLMDLDLILLEERRVLMPRIHFVFIIVRNVTLWVLRILDARQVCKAVADTVLKLGVLESGLCEELWIHHHHLLLVVICLIHVVIWVI